MGYMYVYVREVRNPCTSAHESYGALNLHPLQTADVIFNKGVSQLAESHPFHSPHHASRTMVPV